MEAVKTLLFRSAWWVGGYVYNWTEWAKQVWDCNGMEWWNSRKPPQIPFQHSGILRLSHSENDSRQLSEEPHACIPQPSPTQPADKKCCPPLRASCHCVLSDLVLHKPHWCLTQVWATAAWGRVWAVSVITLTAGWSRSCYVQCSSKGDANAASFRW